MEFFLTTAASLAHFSAHFAPSQAFICLSYAFINIIQDKLLSIGIALRVNRMVSTNIGFDLCKTKFFTTRSRQIQVLALIALFLQKDAFSRKHFSHVCVHKRHHSTFMRDQEIQAAYNTRYRNRFNRNFELGQHFRSKDKFLRCHFTDWARLYNLLRFRSHHLFAAFHHRHNLLL